MKVTKKRQLEINAGKLEELFGNNGSANPTPAQQLGFHSDSIVVPNDGKDVPVNTIVFKTRMATIAYEPSSDVDETQEALGKVAGFIAAGFAGAGLAPIVLNGVSATAGLIKNLADHHDAEGRPEPVMAAFTTKRGCKYTLNVQVEGSIGLSEADDAEDEWASVSAEVNCMGTALKGLDVPSGTKTATKRVTKKIDGQSNPLRQDVSFEFNGSVTGSGAEMTVNISLWRKAHTNGAVTTATASGVYISNIQVHIVEKCPQKKGKIEEKDPETEEEPKKEAKEEEKKEPSKGAKKGSAARKASSGDRKRSEKKASAKPKRRGTSKK